MGSESIISRAAQGRDRAAVLECDRLGELAGPGHEPKRKRVFRVNRALLIFGVVIIFIAERA
jgi:hypothetical protein